MAWSGGSASLSGGPTTFSVSYVAPTFTPPSGASNLRYNTTGGASSLSCGGYNTSRTYSVTYFWSAVGEDVTESTTITSPSTPACPPPAPTDGKLDIYINNAWTSIYPKVYNGSSWVDGTVYVYSGSAWVKAANS